MLNAEEGFDIVSISPTLVNTMATLNITTARKTTVDLIVTDATGKKVQQLKYNLNSGSNQVALQFFHCSAGAYNITVYTTTGNSKTIRFVKQ
jgi:hypothetical protein